MVGVSSLVCFRLTYVCLVLSLPGLSGKEDVQGVGGREEQSSDQDSGSLQRTQGEEELQEKTVRVQFR